MMTDWIAEAGVNQNGIKAGEPRTIKNAERGSLAVLTTVLPDMPEEDRRIFAIFRIGRIHKGDDETAGYVVADSKYRISLTPKETNDLKFWDYYRNESKPNQCQWGSGLFRYLYDNQVAQILKQLSHIKHNTKEKALALDFFEFYCKSQGLEAAEIGEPAGARMIQESHLRR